MINLSRSDCSRILYTLFWEKVLVAKHISTIGQVDGYESVHEVC